MNLHDPYLELKISRILAGFLRFQFKDIIYLIGTPDFKQKYFINEVYLQAIETAKKNGVLSFEDLLNYMMKIGLWSKQHDSQIKLLSKQIENCKVDLYKQRFNPHRVRDIKKQIKKIDKRLTALLDKKFSLHYASATGFASILKNYYDAAYSLYYIDGTSVWNDNSFLKEDYTLLNLVMDYKYANKVSDEEYRKIVKSNTWINLWNASKINLFSSNSANWTEEQQKLVTWSKIYDNIYEHSECPTDKVIEDDDMLDGWMILQYQQRNADKLKKDKEGTLSNPKLAKAQEVFIPANSEEDVEYIHSLNSSVSNATRKAKLKQVSQEGRVKDGNLHDQILKRQLEKNRKLFKKK